MAPSAFHLLCAKQQAEKEVQRLRRFGDDSESHCSGFGQTETWRELQTVLREQLEAFIQGPLEVLIRDAVATALGTCGKEDTIDSASKLMKCRGEGFTKPPPPQTLLPPLQVRDSMCAGFMKNVELPALKVFPETALPRDVTFEGSSTQSDSDCEVLPDMDDDAFTMKATALKIFTEGEETGFTTKSTISGKSSSNAIGRKAVLRNSSKDVFRRNSSKDVSVSKAAEPRVQNFIEEDNRKTSKDDGGANMARRDSRRSSARLSDAQLSLLQRHRVLEQEKVWLCGLRKESAHEPQYLNAADEYHNIEEWREARGCCLWRAEIWLWEKSARLVCNVRFDYCSALFILANSVVVGANTDYVAQNIGAELPGVFRIFDLLFCAVFTAELALKLFVHRLNFYFLQDFKWNVFDTILVCMQLFEEILAAAVGTAETASAPVDNGPVGAAGDEAGAEGEAGSSGIGMNLSFMRVLRILRLVRIVRLFRVLRVIGELRTIVASIIGCLKPLLSAMLLLLLMIYVVGVFFTQAVSTHLLEDPTAEPNPALKENFGSLGQSLFSLFQCVLGGMDWGDVANPLTHEMSTAYGLVFAFYIVFAVLAMMNVMTGVFVEAALAISKRDEEVYMVNHMKQLLKVTDVDDSGEVSWEEFQAQLDNPDMLEYFKCIDVDPSEGQSLFNILDTEETGALEAAQFVSGCLKLRGPARALDLEIFSNQTRKALTKSLENQKKVVTMLQHLAKQISSPAAQPPRRW
eukprot:TRINITY_DN1586_c0_g3_i1.p1 TRINITY_DN1586_c0_g3~~TRINITY_DN1586_c0_g3_i1.p1  ORF type:complete len:746 (-),score=139.57 TRINITY_DN1586_c0_g3_i1:183-2420(-)